MRQACWKIKTPSSAVCSLRILTVGQGQTAEALAVKLQHVERIQHRLTDRPTAVESIEDCDPSGPQTLASPSRVNEWARSFTAVAAIAALTSPPEELTSCAACNGV